MPRRHRRDLRTVSLYVGALIREFRWTLAAVGGAILFGGVLYLVTPLRDLGYLPPLTALYAAWMAMLAQPICPPETWYLALLCGFYPVLGFVLIGEGVVRLALLISSSEHGEKEWMMVKASTYRNHVVICGVGHLGYRVLEQLIAIDVPVVAMEKDEHGRFVVLTKAKGVPLLIHDMRDDQALMDAGVPHARAIIIATNDDIANLEVALDARRMNPKIRVVMRLFDQQIASKIMGALTIDAAFSASALAAPMVAAMSMETKVLASFLVAGVPHVTAEVNVEPQSPLVGKTVAEIESQHKCRALALVPRRGVPQSPVDADVVIAERDVLVVNAPTSRIAALSSAGQPVGV